MGKNVAVEVTADAEVVGDPATIVGVAITKLTAGDQIVLKDGGTGGTVKATIQADSAIYIPLEIDCLVDIYADVTGTGAIYLVIYR